MLDHVLNISSRGCFFVFFLFFWRRVSGGLRKYVVGFQNDFAKKKSPVVWGDGIILCVVCTKIIKVANSIFSIRYFPKTREHALDAITEFAIEIHRRTIKYFNRLN